MKTKFDLEKFQDARKLIVQGWVKGRERVENDKGKVVQVCSIGALREVFGGPGKRIPAPYVGVLANAIATEFPKTYVSDVPEDTVTGFNDRAGTSKKKVLRAFDSAIKAVKIINGF